MTHLRADSAWTLGDPAQLQNALLNVALNARDAMPSGTGSIDISTRRVLLDEQKLVALSADAAPGEYVALSVSDTGMGMDPTTRARIFEPFFTTKDSGNGLGLAAVYGTIRNHKGALSVSSELRRGTVFTLYLPASSPPSSVASIETTSPSGLDGHVLVVDDEAAPRVVVSDMLSSMGSKVTSFGDGREAIAFFEAQHDDVDFVLLDLVMPGMSAVDIFERLKRIDPQVRVAVMSGFTRDGAAQSMIDAGAVAFLQKPFGKSQLARAVERALARPITNQP